MSARVLRAAGLLAALALSGVDGAQAQGAPTVAEWRALWNTGDTEASLAMGERVVKATDSPALSVTLQSELAVYYSVVGQFDRAKAHIEAALDTSRGWRFRTLNEGGTTGYERQQALTRLARAQCHVAVGTRQLEQGRVACEQSLERARRLRELVNFAPNPAALLSHEIDALLDLARLQHIAGRHAAARPLVEAAGELVRQNRVGPGTTVFYTRMAAFMAAEAGDGERAVALGEQGVQTWLAAGTPASAAPLLQARVSLFHALVVQQRWNEAQLELSRIDSALRGQSGARVRPSLMAVALTAAHGGNLAALQARLEATAMSWQQRLGEKHPQVAVLKGLLGASLCSGTRDPDRLARGRRHLAEASALLLEAQRQDDPYLEGRLERQAARYVLEEFLHMQQQGLQAANEFQLAFQVADVLRGSKVQAAMQEAALRLAGASAGLSPLLQREASLRGEILALESQLGSQTESTGDQGRERLAALRVEREQNRSRISSGYPAVAALLNPRSPTPEDVVGRLAVGELFVLLLPVQAGVHLWSLSWTEQQHRFLPLPPQRLAQAVAAIRASTDFGERLRPYALDEARWLGTQLLGPLEASLRQARHVVVAAGGSLGTVPFAALPMGPAALEGAEPWLIRRVAVSQVPSASAWLAIQRLALTGRPNGALLAWGDPVFDGRQAPAKSRGTRRVVAARNASLDNANLPRYSELPALPETRDELLAIASAMQADPGRDLLLGAKATRASVLAANQRGDLATRRVIAFATHGLMAGDLPNLNQPALALTATPDAETNPLSPLLTLDDVLSLRLNADWVVLSACNTAAADGRAEEAMSGLARGFFYAGARSVLVTHWAVETESAKLLTTRTFEHFTANPYAGKAESLRQAMLSVMAMPQYQHPAFWAPYALVGDGAR